MNPLYRFYLENRDSNIYSSSYEGLMANAGINSATGETYETTSYYASGYLPVTAGNIYYITNIRSGAFYDSDKAFLSGIKNKNKAGYIIAPKGAAYMRMSLSNAEYSGNSLKIYEGTRCYPIYKDDLTKDYELESNERFYRAKLSGKINFVADDYALIAGYAFGHVFHFIIYASTDYGQSWDLFFTGKFTLTDCTVNEDDKKIEVQPEVEDEYTDILAGIEKEYNLIELAPEIKRLNISKRPLIQVYRPGDDIVSCFLGGSYWEQDVTEAVSDESALRTKYYFALASTLVIIEATVTGNADSAIAGTYYGKLTMADNGLFSGTFPQLGGTYKIAYSEFIPTGGSGRNATYELQDAEGNVLYSHTATEGMTDGFEAVLMPGAAGTVPITCNVDKIYMRYLCDVESIDDLSTYELPTDDLVENNRNYKRAIGYAFDIAYLSMNTSTEPTEWGVNSDGEYYEPPYSLWNQPFYPIARSYWGEASYWFAFWLLDNVVEESARKSYTLRDAYPISSCIQVLLNKIAPNITHEASTDYSQFLYGTNPISATQFTLLISPKSNVLNGEYQTPAQKAPITLREIFDMLKNCFKCYWFIEDGKLRIEHIEFFRNGGSYSSTSQVSLDLTQLQNIRNGKKWGYLTSKYSFDKIDMAQRYEFAWMDDVTTPFVGLPIEVRSNYVTEGKIEDITIGNFTSDIDMMLLNPGAFSSDGFALFAAITNNSKLELPFIERTVDGTTYYLQNGYLAFIYLQPTFWLYDMPAKELTVNDEDVQAYSIERKKKQTLNCPVAIDFDPMKLVKTYLGNGNIDKCSLSLTSLTAKLTLKYDTE